MPDRQRACATAHATEMTLLEAKMKLSMTIATILAGIALAACGTTTTTSSTTPRVRATPSNISGPPVNPCSLVTRRDASIAFGVRAGAGHRTGPLCVYGAAGHSLNVSAYPVSAAFSAAFRRSVATPQPGKTRVDEAGFQAIADETVPASIATGAQAEIAFIKGRAKLNIVLTDPAKKKGSLVNAVIALGRRVSRER